MSKGWKPFDWKWENLVDAAAMWCDIKQELFAHDKSADDLDAIDHSEMVRHLTLRRHSLHRVTFEAQRKLPLSADPGNVRLNCTDQGRLKFQGNSTITYNNNKHDSTQKHTYTHIHTQRSVQVSLTISGCTAPTDFSWVSRNYFAPPFSTPWRSCLCSFTFPRHGLRKPLSTPAELHAQYRVLVFFNQAHNSQKWITPIDAAQSKNVWNPFFLHTGSKPLTLQLLAWVHMDTQV